MVLTICESFKEALLPLAKLKLEKPGERKPGLWDAWSAYFVTIALNIQIAFSWNFKLSIIMSLVTGSS